MSGQGGGGEEFQGNVAQPPSVVVVLPQYPEMIMSAIEALGEQNGSNKSAISKQIEATYGELPGGHSTLLTHHLNRMKSAGHLLFIKNNYLKPHPDAPPRRGRGRPPKPKSHQPPSSSSPSSSRPRGRPPKSPHTTADTNLPNNSPSLSSVSVSGKKRGRPPKATPKPPPSGSSESGGGVARRGRGRPPKAKPSTSATSSATLVA